MDGDDDDDISGFDDDFAPSSSSSSSSTQHTHNPNRIILLIDMDCFYASVEMLRLGIPKEQPTIVLQWNMALAISYAARKFGVGRGTQVSVIKEKIPNCVVIHCETLNEHDEIKTEQDHHNDIFNASPEERAAALKRENGFLPKRADVKSTLERYRVASQTIFKHIRCFFDEVCGKNNYVYQKASIDEMFLDVTDFCCDQKNQERFLLNSNSARVAKPDKTLRLFSTDPTSDCPQFPQALKLAELVADRLRVSVMENLGFSISCGIAHNKAFAKLAAGKAKPFNVGVLERGESTRRMVQETKLTKVRNFGGESPFGLVVSHNIHAHPLTQESSGRKYWTAWRRTALLLLSPLLATRTVAFGCFRPFWTCRGTSSRSTWAVQGRILSAKWRGEKSTSLLRRRKPALSNNSVA